MMAVVASGGGIEAGSQIEPAGSTGPFTIRQLLSDRGATARVFLAEDANGRQVVVKALRREHWRDDDMRGRFAREYDVLRRLRTQGGHVPEALHLELQPDQPPYLVLSLARGKTLFEHTVQQPLGYLPEPLGLALALPFLDTLAIAHRGIISYTDWMLSEVFWDGEADTFDPATGIDP